MGTAIFIEIENIVNKDVVWLSFQLNDTHKNVCSSNQGLKLIYIYNLTTCFFDK